MLLLQRVSAIDSELADERDSRRAELTARYERDIQALDEEAVTLSASTPLVHTQIAQAQLSEAVRHHSPHVHGSHQDIDIDVVTVLNHIDTNGDGVLTTAEVRGASVGAAIWQAMGAVPTTLLGCTAGVVCYLLCRCLSRWGRHRPQEPRGRLGSMAKPGITPAAHSECAPAPVRNRKKPCAGGPIAC